MIQSYLIYVLLIIWPFHWVKTGKNQKSRLSSWDTYTRNNFFNPQWDWSVVTNDNQGLYVIIMSHTSIRVNLHSIVCLNVKELLARSRRHIWSLSDSNGIRIHKHFVRKRTLNHLAKLASSFVSGGGFESRCCHLDNQGLWKYPHHEK